MHAPRDEPALAELDERVATFRVDRDLTHLGLTWLNFDETADQRAAGERMTYAEARAMWGSYLTVERFSFFLRTRDVFKEVRDADEAGR